MLAWTNYGIKNDDDDDDYKIFFEGADKLYIYFNLFQELLTMNEELKKARKAFDAESYGE